MLAKNGTVYTRSRVKPALYLLISMFLLALGFLFDVIARISGSVDLASILFRLYAVITIPHYLLYSHL